MIQATHSRPLDFEKFSLKKGRVSGSETCENISQN